MEVNRVILTKTNGEHFVFIFGHTIEDCEETLRQVAKLAANQELNFSWFEAAQISNSIRMIIEQISTRSVSLKKVVTDVNDV